MQRLPTCGGQVHLSAARTTPFDAAMQRLHGGSQSNKVRPKKLQCKSTSRSSKLLGHTDQAAHINKPKLPKLSTQLVLYLLTHPALAGVQDIGPLLATAATSARRSRGTHSMQQSACSTSLQEPTLRPSTGACCGRRVRGAGGLGGRPGLRALAAHIHEVQVAPGGQLAQQRAVRDQPRLERALHLRAAPSGQLCSCDCPVLAAVPDSSTILHDSRQPRAPAPAIGHSVTASWHERFAATEACQVTTWLTGPVAASHARTPSNVFRSLPHTWTPESSLQLPPLSLPSDCSPSRDVHSP